MTDVTANFLFAHAFEFRLLLAVAVLPLTYAAIQIISFIGRSVEAIRTKTNDSVSTTTLSAAGAR